MKKLRGGKTSKAKKTKREMINIGGGGAADKLNKEKGAKPKRSRPNKKAEVESEEEEEEVKKVIEKVSISPKTGFFS